MSAAMNECLEFVAKTAQSIALQSNVSQLHYWLKPSQHMTM